MRNRFFATEQSREQFIRNFRQSAAGQDPSLPIIEAHKIIRWQQAAQIAPDADPVEVYRFWSAAQARKKQQATRNLADATPPYIDAMQRMKRHPAYIGHVDKALRDLLDELGDRDLRDFSAADLREHIFSLPYSEVTLNHRRTYLQGAFGWWLKQGWVDENPIRKIETPEVPDKEPGILTVAETEQIFRANEKIDPGICGILALGAFAGMRSSAIARLAFDEIDFNQRGILTPAEKTKKKRRQWIEDLPSNLWQWLRRTPPEIFDLSERQLRHLRTEAFKRAGLLVEADDIARELRKQSRRGSDQREGRGASPSKPADAIRCPPKNCLRHSFATYHVALHRDPGRTALILSHRQQDVLYQHYLGIATQSAASEYFKIKPRK